MSDRRSPPRRDRPAPLPPPAPARAGDSARFEGFLDRTFERRLSDQPILAATQGIQDGEGRLPRATRAAETRRLRENQEALGQLDTFNPRDLSPDQHLDRLALRSLLRREVEDHQRGRAGLEPAAVETLLNILLHELQRGVHAPARAAGNLRSLLAAAPRFLAESASLLGHPEPAWLRIARQTADGAGSMLAAVGRFLADTTRPGDPRRDARLLAAAGRAVASYQRHAEGLAPAPPGSFALGADRLQRRVRDELGLDLTLGEIESLAHAEIARLGGLLEQACRRLGRGSAGEILAAARTAWEPGEDLPALYRRETERVARGFREAGLVAFPAGESLEITPVPDFLRHLFPTAAYSSPGAFEASQRGVFWVNDLGATLADPAARRAERQQHFGLGLTCAHEAYPGHHLQFVTANRHPRRWRRLFAHAVFYEGWTLWCERLLGDLRLDPGPGFAVQQLHDALWRAHRILVDLRLQTGRYPYREAARHLEKHLHFTRARAEADVNWYLGAPGVPMSYWLGRLENERLHQRLVAGRGWSPRRFHDWLLSHGTLPQAWLERYLLD